MQKTKFDNYANNYDKLMQKQHSIFGNISYYSEYKVKIAHQILKRYFKNNLKLNILEYGCETGRNLPYLKIMFPMSTVYGFDISQDSLEKAKSNNHDVMFLCIEDELLKYEDYFDVVFIAGVYHHVQPTIRRHVTNLIKYVTRQHGKVIVFEHNPLNPVTRHIVNTCEFDDDAVLLFKNELINIFRITGFCLLKSGYTLFVPPRFRRLSFIEKFLDWVPLGGQYYVVFKKNECK